MGDLGISKGGLGAGLGTPIVDMLGPRIYNTARLTLLVAVIAIPISLCLGLDCRNASRYQVRSVDHVYHSQFDLSARFFGGDSFGLIFAVALGWLLAIVYLRGDETGWMLLQNFSDARIDLNHCRLVADHPNDTSDHIECVEFTLY